MSDALTVKDSFPCSETGRISAVSYHVLTFKVLKSSRFIYLLILLFKSIPDLYVTPVPIKYKWGTCSNI
jgi:hypothetical protein